MSADDDKHARLRQARLRSYKTAKAAAAAMNVPYGTYSGHEAGSRGFDNDEAARYARFFRVRTDWLIFGTGDQTEVRIRPLAGQIVRGGHVQRFDPPKGKAGEPFVIIDSIISGAAAGYFVSGYEMMPWFVPDALFVCGYRIEHDYDLSGRLAIVGIENDTPQLALIHRSASGDGFDLERFGAPPVQEAGILWAEEVLAIIPAQHWGLQYDRRKAA